MKLEDIIESYKKDLLIDDSDLKKESLRKVDLFVKYRNILTEEKMRLHMLDKKMRKLLIEKKIYYSGKAEPEVYKEKPFDLRLTRDQISEYVNADDEVMELEDKINIQKEKISTLTDVLKTIDKRGFDIKNAIDYIKFIHGET